MENQNNQALGPSKITPLSFALKIVAGISAGILGLAVLLIIFLLGSSIFDAFLKGGTEKIHPLFIFVFIAMVFLSTLVANLSGAFFLSLSEEEKYRKISSTLYQIFIINLIIFVINAPFYFIGINISTSAVIYIAGLQILISTMASMMTFKIVSTPQYGILGVYVFVLATLSAVGLNYIVFQITKENMTFQVFAVLPIVWICIGFFEAVVELLYYSVYSLYGVDFLNRETDYGEDVGEELGIDAASEEVDKERLEEFKITHRKDQTGAEFLNEENKN